MRSKLLLLAIPVAILFAAPAAHAAPALKIPMPAAGDVTVVTAKAGKPGKLKVGGKLPDGVVVLGGVAKRTAVVAVVRPSGVKATGSVKIVGPKLTRAKTVKSALRGASLGTACSSAGPLLGKVVAGKFADARRLGAILYTAVCGGGGLSAADRAFLVDKGLAAAKSQPSDGAQPGPTPGPTTTPATPTATPSPSPSPSPGPSPSPSPSPSPQPADQCTDGKDNDGDGQIDFYSQFGTFVDPGCSEPGDNTETGEKAVPRACGLGVYTKDSTQGYGADFDSISHDDCPKGLVRGVVDLDVPVTCDDWGYEGSKKGFCSVISGNAMLTGAKGDQWQTSGTSAASLCGKQAYLLSWQENGTAWEYKTTVFDGAEVCKGGESKAQCANGLDDDGDGQADHGGVPGKSPDPGCSGATDTSESSEVAFPSGCVGVLAFRPGNPNPKRMVALTGTTQQGATCPTVDTVWIDLATTGIVACGTPQWGGVEAGQCALGTGDSIVATGGSSSDFLLGLDVGVDASCDLDGKGTFAMRGIDGTAYESPVRAATWTEEGITLC